MRVEIRPLGPGDVEEPHLDPAVVNSMVAAGASGGGHLSAFLADQRNLLYVARDHDRCVDFLVAYLLDRMDGERSTVLVYELEMALVHQGRGVGRALVAPLKTLGCDLEAVKIWVAT